jgi:hypothetical protein
MTTDLVMAEILAAIGLLHGGDRSGGRAKLEAIWSRISHDAEPIHECTLSHYMADAQDDVTQELAWDIRALDAALRCTDTDAQRQSQALSIAAFMPSLHANLAEDYFKLGDVALSKTHLATARDFASALQDDAYGQMLRGGIERLARKLETHEERPSTALSQ